MSQTYKTFDEWSKLGYKIIKGSKATWFDDKPKFSRSQVQKSPWDFRLAEYDDYEDMMKYGNMPW